MPIALDLTLGQFLGLQMMLAMFSVFSTGFIRLTLKATGKGIEETAFFKDKLPYLSVLCGSVGALIVYFERGGILVGGVDYGWLVHAMGGGIGGACGPMIYDRFTSKLYWMTDEALSRVLGGVSTTSPTEPQSQLSAEDTEDAPHPQDDR